jgi:hypothetical protein
MYNGIKGKKNRLELNQKVRAKQSLVDWISEHLSWSYGRHVQESAYSPGEKEIPLESLRDVYLWALAKLSGNNPVGSIEGYGSRDNDEGVDRNNVFVNFTFNTELGKIQYMTFVREKDLIKIVKKK